MYSRPRILQCSDITGQNANNTYCYFYCSNCSLNVSAAERQMLKTCHTCTTYMCVRVIYKHIRSCEHIAHTRILWVRLCAQGKSEGKKQTSKEERTRRPCKWKVMLVKNEYWISSSSRAEVGGSGGSSSGGSWCLLFIPSPGARRTMSGTDSTIEYTEIRLRICLEPRPLLLLSPI